MKSMVYETTEGIKYIDYNDDGSISVKDRLSGVQVDYEENLDDFYAWLAKVSPVKRRNSMKAVWLPANQCWCVVFGDALCGIGSANRYLFNTKAELIWELKQCGITPGEVGL
jgi:hypothetical protein